MRWIYVLAPLAVLVVAIAAWVFVLPACALRAPLGAALAGECPAEGPDEAALAAEAEIARTRVLEAELRRLERRLADMAQCPIPEPSPEPRVDPWEARDMRALEGCWALDGPYPLQNFQTDATDRTQGWRVCFDADGAVVQRFEFEDGVTCEGLLQARFDAESELLLDDTADVTCSDGNPVLRRSGRCSRTPEGALQCTMADPEGPPADLTLRPEPGTGAGEQPR